MQIDFDATKRAWTLEQRGLDFAAASDVFAGEHFTAEDVRPGYRNVDSSPSAAGRPAGGVGVDRPWRDPPDHFYEESQCP